MVRSERVREMKKIQISELEISVRLYNLLRQCDFSFLDELTEIKKYELMKYKNFGSASLKEISKIMTENGLYFKDDEPSYTISEIRNSLSEIINKNDLEFYINQIKK